MTERGLDDVALERGRVTSPVGERASEPMRDEGGIELLHDIEQRHVVWLLVGPGAEHEVVGARSS